MNKAIQIREAYFPHKNQMVPVVKGILSLDGESAIDAFRKAAAAEKKALESSKQDQLSKTCKSK